MQSTPRRRSGAIIALLCISAATLLLVTSLHSRLSATPRSPLTLNIRIVASESLDTDEDEHLQIIEEKEHSNHLLTDESSSLVWDHAIGVARREFGKADNRHDENEGVVDSKIVFGSDDQPVGEGVRRNLELFRTVEDALLSSKNHPLLEDPDGALKRESRPRFR